MGGYRSVAVGQKSRKQAFNVEKTALLQLYA